MNQTPSPGSLYLIATPIGNLEDISPRALRLLAEVDLIACEDTRHSKKLLAYYGITTRVISYYREKERQRAGNLLDLLLQGKSVALISDAGTPGIADPGAVVATLARQQGIPVIPVPGPCALTTALSAAGLTQTPFYFGGFLPAKKGQRRSHLTSLAGLPCTLVFYESPRRIRETLMDCLEVLGSRQALLFRELTKLHEECLTGSFTRIIENLPDPVRGELVLIVLPAEGVCEQHNNLDELLLWHRDQGTSLKDAVGQTAAALGLARGPVYQKALAVWHGEINEEHDTNAEN